MLENILNYFTELVQGNNSLHLRKWINGNEEVLRNSFNRSRFLRIKYNPFEEIPKILIENNISFEINEKAWKNEILYYGFDESVLDENGAFDISKISETEIYLKHYLNGELIKAKETFKTYIKENQPEELDDCLSETLGDDLFFAHTIKEHYYDLAFFIVSEMKEYFNNQNMKFAELESSYKELINVTK